MDHSALLSELQQAWGVEAPESDTATTIQPINRSKQLLDLPHVALTEILAMCSNVGKVMLRQTCRKFTRVFDDKRFDDIRMLDCSFNSRVQMTSPDHRKFTKEEQEELRALLRHIIYCKPCQNFKALGIESPDFKEPLFCSGCQLPHYKIMFSSAQRQLPDWERICIGLEGSVRLCCHVSLKFENFEELMSGRQPGPVYNSATGQVEYSSRAIFRCKEPCRAPPFIINIVDTGYERRYQLQFSWNEKFAIYASHQEPLQPIHRSMLKHELSILAVSDGRWRCPYEDLPAVLKVFNPERCTCFGDGNVDIHHDTSNCIHNTPHPEGKCCRCNHIEKGGTREPRGLAPGSEHQGECPCGAHASYSFTQAAKGEDGIHLEYECNIIANTPSDYSWVASLHRQSYSVGQPGDFEGLHRYWCRDPECATSRRGLKLRTLFEKDGALLQDEAGYKKAGMR